jgi:hypothetical protein
LIAANVQFSEILGVHPQLLGHVLSTIYNPKVSSFSHLHSSLFFMTNLGFQICGTFKKPHRVDLEDQQALDLVVKSKKRCFGSFSENLSSTGLDGRCSQSFFKLSGWSKFLQNGSDFSLPFSFGTMSRTNSVNGVEASIDPVGRSNVLTAFHRDACAFNAYLHCIYAFRTKI